MHIKLISFLLVLVVYVGFVVYESLTLTHENPAYQAYIEEYQQNVEKAVRASQTDPAMSLNYVSSQSKGTSSNFEGPQVLLKAIKFHNEILTKEDERLKHFDGVSAIFDPDHAYYGLPDVKISVKDVRLYQPEESRIAGFLGFNDAPKPYKTYKKTLVDSTQKTKLFEMQLWLTEFEVTVDIRPDLDTHNAKRDEDGDNITYPGYWYGLQKKSVTLNDLVAEFKDQRYGNLAFILEVIPDSSPIYVHTNNAQTSKADFAIGAIYCTKAIIGNEEKVQRINTNIHSGQPVFMNHEFDFDKMNQNPGGYAESVTGNVDRILNSDRPQDTFIWNKPYYIKLHFTNLGTWRSGLLNQNKFHDQVTYSFLMPVFVVGSWDVIAPQEVLPKWAPPSPYVRKFTFTNLMPFWAKGLWGKVTGCVILALALITGIRILLPGIGKRVRKFFWK